MLSCKQDKRGTAIIDGLRICFLAHHHLLEDLSQIEPEKKNCIGRYLLTREKGILHKYAFSVEHKINGKIQKFGHLRFGLENKELNPFFVWLTIENRVLYDKFELKKIYDFCESLNLVFHNFTVLDIAVDFKINVVSLIRKLYKDLENDTIFNGKKIQNRKKVIDGMTHLYSTTLDRLVNPTIYFKQHEAIHDKTKGVVVTAYNKVAEVKNSSEKQYILDYYGNPKTLHRFEVHLNTKQIALYGRKIQEAPSFDWIFDQKILEDIYYDHLQSVIRFTKAKSKKKIDWRELLFNNPYANQKKKSVVNKSKQTESQMVKALLKMESGIPIPIICHKYDISPLELDVWRNADVNAAQTKKIKKELEEDSRRAKQIYDEVMALI